MDLKTNYMDLELNNPVVASASPLGRDLDAIRTMEDAGVAAIVLPSLFEEQIEHEAGELDHFLHYGTERFGESLTFYPEIEEFKLSDEQYLDHIGEARDAVDVPIIASLNGVSAGGWTSYARKMQEAGAAAIELNVYFLPTSPAVGPGDVEDAHLSIFSAVKESVDIPVAVKLSPFFSSFSFLATRLAGAGADALVLFNRFYQPDIDVMKLEVGPHLVLSDPSESRLPLRWIAILFSTVKTSLAATTGIHSGQDVARMILAGADVAMMASALLLHGPEHIRTVLDELRGVMSHHGYDSVSQMKGILSLRDCPEPAAFERANYLKTLQSYVVTGTRE